MILSRVLAVIFGLQCASGYRHEMHLKTRNETSSNKSTEHGGASGDTQVSLTCETGLSSFDCEGSNDYYEDSFKYIGHGKCCTPKSLACEEDAEPSACEGEHGQGRKKGWKFIRSKESRYIGKCCLVTDSQVWLTCETGLSSFDCEGSNDYYEDSFQYIGNGKCCTPKSLACEEDAEPSACEGEDGQGRKKGWKFIRSKESRYIGKCCLVPLDKPRG
ncbi:Scn10a [Symbiodinium sp. KB8]|nr:Scn10a [Symbiodinium sp. KB8]